MGEWVIAVSLLVAAFILGRAIEDIVKKTELQRNERENQRAQLMAVSHIVGTLISAVISNPKYLEAIDQLKADRVEVIMSEEDQDKKDRRKIAEDVLNETSVFHWKGREKYLELAMSIYGKVEKELKESIV